MEKRACPRCQVVAVPTIGPGRGPHGASASCAHCGRFLKWCKAERQPMIKTTGGVNRVVLAGVIGQRGAEVVFQSAGNAVASFTLVLQEPGKNAQLFLLYVPVETFGKGAENVGELLPGQAALVDGNLRWRAGADGKNGGLVVTAWAWDVRALVLMPEKESVNA